MTRTRALRALLGAAAIVAGGTSCGPGDGGGVSGVLVVANVDVSPGITNVVVGTTVQLTATPKTASGIVVTGRAVSWSSTDAAVASVSGSGLVTGVTVGGPVRVRATVDGVNGDALITVKPVPVDHITLSPEAIGLLVGEQKPFTPTAFDAQGGVLTGRSFLWESSDPGIAAVTSTGIVIGVSQGGPVTITASTEGKVGTGTASVSTRPATRLAFATQPPASTAGAPLNPPIRVALQDDLLSTVLGATNTVTLELVTNPGGATVGGTTTLNGVNGIATFGNITLDRVGAGYVFRATSPGLLSATSDPFTITAGSANRLGITTQPSAAAQSGVALVQQPVVRLQDGNGNPVATAGLVVTAAVASGNGTLGGTTTATTNSQGIATFTNLVINGTIGSYTVSFTSPGVTPATSNAITLSAGPKAKLGIVTQPSATAQSGIPLTQQPAVQLQDAAGNAVADAGVQVTVSLASGTGTLGGSTTAVTNAAGVATFSIAINGGSGTYTLGFQSPALTPAVSGPIILGAGAPTQVGIVTQPSATAVNGVALTVQPVVQLRDASNNPVALAGVQISAAVSAGATLSGSAVITTNASGTATFTNLVLTGPVGSYNLSFTAAGLTPAVSITIQLTPGAATNLTITTQPSAAAQSGVVLAQQPVIQVRDASGNAVPAPSLTITAALASGPGTGVLGGTLTAVTNASGVATFTNLMITGPAGSYTLRFTSGSLTAVVSGTVTLGAGAPARLFLATAPSATAQSGVVFGQQPAIQLRDASDNPVAQAGVVVTAAIASGGGTLGGTATATTNGAGLATFTNLTISGTIGDRTLTFTSGVLTAATSGTITLTPGPASKLTITTQPANLAQSGVAFTIQPVIQLRDASDNAVSSAGVNVTAAIATGGGTLGGTATVATNASGVATFTNLMITGTAGDRTLSFSSGSLTTVTSQTVTISAGAPSVLSITTTPSASVQNNIAFPQQPVIQLLDGASNPVALAGVVVTAAIGSGGGTLGGTVTATTNGSGLATFTNLSILGTIGSRTLLFTATGYTSATSGAINVTAGTATKLVLTTQPSAAPASGIPFPVQPVVQLQDISSNNVPTAGVAVTAAITAGGTGTLSGTTTATTGAGGAATFTNLAISGTAGAPSRTLTFTSGALTAAVSSAITLTAGPAAKLSITTQPTAGQSGVALSPQPVVQLRDAADNAVSQAGVVVSVALASGGGSLGGSTTATSNASGVATFSTLAISGAPGAKTLTFSSGALTPVTTPTAITLSAGPASQLVITTPPSTTAQSGIAFVQQPVIQLRDAAGNDVASAGVNVTAGIATGGGTLGGVATVATNAGGTAAFAGLSISGTAGDRTLAFSSGALTPATSGVITVTAGAASNLSITTQPSTSAVNTQAFAVQPVIQLRDASNNPVSLAGVVVTASISTGGGVLGGTITATTNASGVATFSNLAITGTVGNRTLLFSAPGYTSVTSNAVGITPGPAVKLFVSTQPSSAPQSGVAFPQQPGVRLRDVSDNNVSQAGTVVTAALSAGSTGTLGGTLTAATDAAGIATFSNLAISGLVGSNRTLDFTSPGLTTATSATVALVPGPQSQLTITTAPSASAQSGVTFGSQPVVQLRDASGNAVSAGGVPVTVSVASGPGGTLGGSTTVTTDGNGTATFTGLSLSGATGAYTLGFSSSGLTSPAPAPVTLSAGPGSVLGLATAPSSSVQNDIPFPTQPVLQLRDGASNPVAVAGVAVSAVIQTGGGALGGTTTVFTDANGTATFTNLKITGTIGARTLLFSAAGYTSPPVSTVTVTAGTATALALTTAPTSAPQNTVAFPQQPIVQLQDLSGNNVPLAGTIVTAEINSGGGTLGGTTTSTTNASGTATFTNLSIVGTVGARTLRFTASGLSQVLSGTLNLGAGPATKLSITTQPSTPASQGVALATQPVIQLRDFSDNAVSSSGVVVTAAIASGTGILGGTTTATSNASGAASFTNLSLTGTAGAFTLSFSAPSLTGTTSSAVVLNAGAASKLSVTTQPSATATNDAAFTTQPTIQLRDAADNVVSQAGVVVTASITAPGTGTLGGTVTASTNGSGLATFTNLKITGLVGNRTLDFTATGLTGVTSNPIDVTAGTPHHLALTTQPASAAQSGVTFTTQPAVQLQDVSNNPVSQAGTLVTAVITPPGTGTLGGTTTATTSGSGLATFTNLSISGTIGARTLDFSASGVNPVTSGTITLSAGPASVLFPTTAVSATATNDQPFGQQPVFQLRDAAGNNVASAGIGVTATIGSGTGAAIGGTTTVSSDANGMVTFTNLKLTGTVGSFTLAFNGTGLGQYLSGTIVLSAGTATTLAANSATSQSGTVGEAVAAPPSAKATDISGNPVSGVAVTFAVGLGGGTVLPVAPVNTNALGVATATSWTLGPTAGTNNNTATAAASGLGGSPVTFTASAAAGSASKLFVSTQPSTSVANAVNFPVQPAVRLRDAGDNNVLQAGVVITAAIATGGGTLNGTLTATTDVNGIATFSNLSITGLVGDRTLIFTSGSLTSATSGTITITTGARSKLTLTTAPSSSVSSGVAFPQQPVARIEDSGGNPVSENGTGVTVSISSGAGTLSGTTTVNTNASGVATFTDLVITGSSGARTLQFAATGLTSATAGVTVGAGSATQLFLATAPSASAQNAVAFATQPAVQLRDGSNNNVAQAGVNVTAEILTGGGTLNGTLTVATDANGLATFSGLSITGLVGDRTLRFVSGALSPVSSGNVSITTGARSKLTLTTAPSSSVSSGVAFPQQPVARIEDSGGNPVSENGTGVTVSISSGAGALSGTTTVNTNASGVATFTDLVITGSSGARTLQFAATGLTSATAGVTVGAGSATQLAVTAQPTSSVANDVVFPAQPAVQLRDGSNNNVAQAGVVVTAAITAPGTGTLGGTTTATTDANGLATFANLKIVGLIGDRTLTFTSGSLTSATSGTITITTGSAARLTVTTAPTATPQNDIVFPTQPVVRIEDSGGNPVSQDGTAVTASISVGAGALAGTTSVNTAGGGIATFTDLKITGTVGARTIQFAASGLSSATANVTLTPGNATKLFLATAPSATAANAVAFGTQPAVQLRDISDNNVAQAGVNVTAAILSGGGTLNGTATVATDANGLATFAGLSITGTIGIRTLRFTSGSLTLVDSGNIDITVGTAAALSITTDVPAAATNDAVFAPQPVIQLRDSGGNAVSTAGVSVTIEIVTGPGGGVIGGTTTVTTDANGVATFSGLKFTGAGTYTVRFTSSGLTTVTSPTSVIVT